MSLLEHLDESVTNDLLKRGIEAMRTELEQAQEDVRWERNAKVQAWRDADNARTEVRSLREQLIGSGASDLMVAMLRGIEALGITNLPVELLRPFSLGAGSKILTIKAVRHLTHVGLKEAKDIVDAWQADGLARF